MGNSTDREMKGKEVIKAKHMHQSRYLTRCELEMLALTFEATKML